MSLRRRLERLENRKPPARGYLVVNHGDHLILASAGRRSVVTEEQAEKIIGDNPRLWVNLKK